MNFIVSAYCFDEFYYLSVSYVYIQYYGSSPLLPLLYLPSASTMPTSQPAAFLNHNLLTINLAKVVCLTIDLELPTRGSCTTERHDSPLFLSLSAGSNQFSSEK